MEAPPQAAADPWSVFPFVRHAPADTEAFLAVRRPAELWRAVAPAWTPLLEDPGLRDWWQGTAPGRITAAFLEAPRTPPLLEALAAAAEHEMFILCGKGTGSQLAALQQVKRLFEAARLRNLFTPWPAGEAPPEESPPLEELPDDLASAAFTEVIVPLPPAMQETLEAFARDAAIPPLLIGAKIPDDSPLPRLIDEWIAGLPEKIPRDRVDAGEHGQFTRVRLPVTMLVPSAVAVRARDLLATNIGDVYAATYLVRDLLSKVTTLGFGRMHGYFVVSVGTESGLPSIVNESGTSLASAAVIQRLEPLLAGESEAVFYGDQLVVSLAAAPPPVGEYLDAAVESALEFAPTEAIEPLRAQAEPLRAHATELFRPRTAPVGGLVRQTKVGWQMDLFGGSFAPRLASGNAAPLITPSPGIDILWTENWEEGYARRLLDFSGGMAAFAADWTEVLGPVFLDEKRQATAGALLRFVGGPLEQLKDKIGPLVQSALGPQVAMAVSLDGTMPPPPLLSSAAEKALLPRVALGAALRDREALARGWEELASQQSARWPQPAASIAPDGAVTYDYPLPLGGPDLGVVVTVAGNRWLFGNSRAFNMGVATMPPPSSGETSVQNIEFTTAPLATFAAAWSAALAGDPALAPLTAGLIPSDPGTLAAAAEILKTPRQFLYRARWDKDMLHREFMLRPAP